MPAGLRALWSFAEMFRIASALELDVDPRELEIGLQPYPVERQVARRVFLADARENGAGYATQLGRPRRPRTRLRRGSRASSAADYEARRARRECDASCPDCLRSYDNRRLHPYLDWRLALDLAERRERRALPLERWLPHAGAAARAFARGFDLTDVELKGCGARSSPGLVASRSSAIRSGDRTSRSGWTSK